MADKYGFIYETPDDTEGVLSSTTSTTTTAGSKGHNHRVVVGSYKLMFRSVERPHITSSTYS
jgi:hypothetical protein